MVKGGIEEVFFHVGPMKHRSSGNKHISNGIHRLFPNKTFLGKEKKTHAHTHTPKKTESWGEIQSFTLRIFGLMWFLLVWFCFICAFCFELFFSPPWKFFYVLACRAHIFKNIPALQIWENLGLVIPPECCQDSFWGAAHKVSMPNGRQGGDMTTGE